MLEEWTNKPGLRYAPGILIFTYRCSAGYLAQQNNRRKIVLIRSCPTRSFTCTGARVYQIDTRADGMTTAVGRSRGQNYCCCARDAIQGRQVTNVNPCLLYTSDAADE